MLYLARSIRDFLQSFIVYAAHWNVALFINGNNPMNGLPNKQCLSFFFLLYYADLVITRHKNAATIYNHTVAAVCLTGGKINCNSEV